MVRFVIGEVIRAVSVRHEDIPFQVLYVEIQVGLQGVQFITDVQLQVLIELTVISQMKQMLVIRLPDLGIVLCRAIGGKPSSEE